LREPELQLVHEVQNGSDPSRPVYLLCVFRDENLLLPHFVDYYRRLGVSHFLFVDNQSLDDGPRYLQGLEDINLRLFRADSSYREAGFGTDWVNSLLTRYGAGQYCFTVDVDELFTFDRRRYGSLNEVIREMEASASNVVPTTLLDMYPYETNDLYRRGGDFLEHSPFFDAYNTSYYAMRGTIYDTWAHKVGGVRNRVLGTTVCIHKLPFFRYDFSPVGVAPGYHFFQRDGRILRQSDQIHLLEHPAVLLHFKFIKPYFKAFVERRLAHNEDWNDSAEYRSYSEVLKSRDSIRFWSPEFSKRLERAEDLSAFFQDCR